MEFRVGKDEIIEKVWFPYRLRTPWYFRRGGKYYANASKGTSSFLIIDQGLKPQEIVKLYWVSLTTLKRIMKEDMIHKIRELDFHKLDWPKILKSKYLQKVILAYLSKQISSTYSHGVQEMSESDYDVKVGLQQIIKWMKSELGLSFKRGTSRKVRYDANKIRLQKCIFAAKLCKILPHIELIINVGEASLSKSVKLSYA